jgi:hypothetical protein
MKKTTVLSILLFIAFGTTYQLSAHPYSLHSTLVVHMPIFYLELEQHSGNPQSILVVTDTGNFAQLDRQKDAESAQWYSTHELGMHFKDDEFKNRFIKDTSAENQKKINIAKKMLRLCEEQEADTSIYYRAAIAQDTVIVAYKNNMSHTLTVYCKEDNQWVAQELLHTNSEITAIDVNIEGSIIIVGTKTGYVYVWTRPEKAQYIRYADSISNPGVCSIL